MTALISESHPGTLVEHVLIRGKRKIFRFLVTKTADKIVYLHVEAQITKLIEVDRAAEYVFDYPDLGKES